MENTKIKVAFYLENKGYPDADLRFPEWGNPGIGGTQFTTVATAYYLNKFYSDQVEVYLLANSTELLPQSLTALKVEDELAAAVISEHQGYDIFIFKSRPGNHKIYEQLRQLKIKAIARSNNTPDLAGLNQIASCPQIKSHVCVGQEQLDFLRDHRVFQKSIRIFNPFNSQNFVPQAEIAKKDNTVVFLGNIIPSKGFHYLARVWPNIVSKKPEAKLIVIGSGKLYDRSKKLGKWGVGEEHYETNHIRPYLSDANGNIAESVHFAGLLGKEKIPILQSAAVGVANPSGKTETFCSAAVEFQACGTPVVSAANGGLLDTVVHKKTGLLGNSDRALERNILYLLNNPSVAKQFGENGIRFVSDNFSPELNAKQWLELLVCIHQNQQISQQPMKTNYFYKAKFAREGMRISKQLIPPLSKVPSLLELSQKLKSQV